MGPGVPSCGQRGGFSWADPEAWCPGLDTRYGWTLGKASWLGWLGGRNYIIQTMRVGIGAGEGRGPSRGPLGKRVRPPGWATSPGKAGLSTLLQPPSPSTCEVLANRAAAVRGQSPCLLPTGPGERTLMGEGGQREQLGAQKPVRPRLLLSYAQPSAGWRQALPPSPLPSSLCVFGASRRTPTPQTPGLHPGLFSGIRRLLSVKQLVSAPKGGQAGCPHCAPSHQPLPARPASCRPPLPARSWEKCPSAGHGVERAAGRRRDGGARSPVQWPWPRRDKDTEQALHWGSDGSQGQADSPAWLCGVTGQSRAPGSSPRVRVPRSSPLQTGCRGVRLCSQLPCSGPGA